jgi:hypothetical protein
LLSSANGFNPRGLGLSLGSSHLQNLQNIQNIQNLQNIQNIPVSDSEVISNNSHLTGKTQFKTI